MSYRVIFWLSLPIGIVMGHLIGRYVEVLLRIATYYNALWKIRGIEAQSAVKELEREMRRR
jgi:hypothetical protein